MGSVLLFKGPKGRFRYERGSKKAIGGLHPRGAPARESAAARRLPAPPPAARPCQHLCSRSVGGASCWRGLPAPLWMATRRRGARAVLGRACMMPCAAHPLQACLRAAAASPPCSRWRRRSCGTPMTPPPCPSSTPTCRVSTTPRCRPLVRAPAGCAVRAPAARPRRFGGPRLLVCCACRAVWPGLLPTVATPPMLVSGRSTIPTTTHTYPHAHTHTHTPLPSCIEEDILLRKELDDLAAQHPNFRRGTRRRRCEGPACPHLCLPTSAACVPRPESPCVQAAPLHPLLAWPPAWCTRWTGRGVVPCWPELLHIPENAVWPRRPPEPPPACSVYYVLNNPPKGWTGGKGFVTADMIK